MKNTPIVVSQTIQLIVLKYEIKLAKLDWHPNSYSGVHFGRQGF
ncbi:hypothetical protein P7H59_01655 [Enterococcus viikkiensis]|uniref:Uncharacterized protein n=1 Tax=Enterococcus viikkiensis TaxID=930854 RepID=A0ABU3FNA4_9ENTE|nr:hypothetical protein [Enterococcus viikkiensis]